MKKIGQIFFIAVAVYTLLWGQGQECGFYLYKGEKSYYVSLEEKIKVSSEGTLESSVSSEGNSESSESYEKVRYLGNNRYAFKKNGKWGIMNRKGNIIVPAKYDDIGYSFHEGLLYVGLECKTSWGGILTECQKTGFIDENGKEVIPLKYEKVGTPSEGLIPVKQDGKWGYVNLQGETVLPCKLDGAESFSEGLAAVRVNKLWGYADKQMNVVIRFALLDAKPFHEGLAPVKIPLEKIGYGILEGKWGVINKKGEVIVPPEYDEISLFREGFAIVAQKDAKESVGFDFDSKTKYGIIDKEGNEIVPPKYDKIYEFHEGLAKVQLNGKWGIIDTKGNIVVPVKYESVANSCGKIGVLSGNKIQIMDKTGKILKEISL